MVDIIARLKLKAEDFSRSTKQAFSGVEQDADRAGQAAGKKFGTGFSAGANALLTGATIGIIAALGQRALDYASNLKTVSQQVGIATKDFQEYRYAALQVGVAQDDLTESLQTLQVKIGEARKGNKQAGAAFRDLGIDVTSAGGSAKQTGVVMDELVRQVSAIQDPVKRATLEAQLFGDNWKKIDPLLAGGASRIDGLRDAAQSLGIVLSDKQIQDADLTAKKLEQVKLVLEARIAGIVSDNTDAIMGLANAFEWAAGKASYFVQTLEGSKRLMRDEGWASGFFASPGRLETAGNPVNYVRSRTSDLTKATAERRRLEQENAPNRSGANARAQAREREADARKLLQAAINDPAFRSLTQRGVPAAPRPVLPQPASDTPRGSGSGASRGSSGSGGDQRAREIKQAQAEEERLRASLDKTIQSQQDSGRIAAIRAKDGDLAADREQALLEIARQFPTLEGATVEQLIKKYNITEDQAKLDLERYRLARDTAVAEVDANAARKDAEKQARDRLAADKEAQEEIERLQQEANERQQRAFEDLATFYMDVFSGNTGNIWKDFKRQGLETISAIAAQYTLSLLSGNKFDIGSALGTAGSQSGSPLGTLLSAIGGQSKGIFGNQTAAEAASSALSTLVPVGSTKLPLGMGGSSGTLGSAASTSATLSSIGSAAGAFGAAVAVNQMVGDIFGFKGGPLGIFTGLFTKTKKASSTLSVQDGEVAAGAASGNSATYRANANSLAGSVSDQINAIAEALGADVSGPLGLSIGQRKKKFVVDTTGSGRTKGTGTLSFATEEEAIMAGIRDALSDGVLTGISQASQNILRSGRDLEKSISKAASIEAIGKTLRARLDPLGAALDEIDAKFATLAATLKEGGGSAEQIAQARQLWELERADTIAQIGQASSSLKDFLSSLKAGSSSPLSLRDQNKAALAELAPYEAQISAARAARAEVNALDLKRNNGIAVDDATYKAAVEAAAAAAAKIDQEKYQETASLFLSIQRQLEGSTDAYFDQFNRISSMTENAIGLIDKAAPAVGEAKDPFAELTAKATQATANMTEQTNALLANLPDQIAARLSALGYGNVGSFIGTGRNYVNLR